MVTASCGGPFDIALKTAGYDGLIIKGKSASPVYLQIADEKVDFLDAAATTFPPMTKALLLPEGHQCMGSMMVGYPKFRYHRLPLRKSPEITWRL